MKLDATIGSCLRVQIKGGVTVCLPADIDLLTPYVLLEQEDWFEDEIKFIRRLLRPGMVAVDIGANYGVYTLTAAAAVTESGKVWAFEPARTTAEFLGCSIRENQLDHIQLIQAGVSDHSGAGLLTLNVDSELNAIVSGDADSGSCEKIALTTLDEWGEQNGWPAVDFIKIDAEGHENNIITGGREFFARQSPLIMYEIREQSNWNLELANRFNSLGYKNYRLVPGLNLLAPFSDEGEPDPFLLNLFSCKPDRAAMLADKDYLVLSSSQRKPVRCGAEVWRYYLLNYPYARKLEAYWASAEDSGRSEDGVLYRRMLDSYASAMDEGKSAPVRYACLNSAYERAREIASGRAGLPRMMSCARIAMAFGERLWAKNLIVDILRTIQTSGRIPLEEPFLSVSPRLENVDPGPFLQNWLLSSLLEQMMLLESTSSYYGGEECMHNLEALKAMGFQGAEMERRRQLVRMRRGIQALPEKSPALSDKKTEVGCRNREFWFGNQQ